MKLTGNVDHIIKKWENPDILIIKDSYKACCKDTYGSGTMFQHFMHLENIAHI